MKIKTLREKLEDIKAIILLVMFFMGLTGVGANEYMKKSNQLESATHAVKEISKLVVSNKEKFVSHEAVVHTIDDKELERLEDKFDDHLRKLH